jgi:hypothetical protein
VCILGASNAFSAGNVVRVHGHSGHIEYQDRVQSDRQFLGWGLQFTQSSGQYNWIHYSIPVQRHNKVRYIGIFFETGSIDIGITTLDVYDGDTRIYRKSGLNLSGGKQWYILDMGSFQTINKGLGLSIEVGAGVEQMSTVMIIYSVAAVLVDNSVPDRLDLISPEGTISQTSPTFTWHPSAGATWYHLWIGDDASSLVFSKWYTASEVHDMINECSVTPQGLSLSSGNYTWWVRSYNSYGYSSWSSGMDFTVQ